MPADRPHDVSSLTADQLEHARRDLQVRCTPTVTVLTVYLMILVDEMIDL